ncbi:MAG TPA: FtsX-like permease family protein [Candidatus Elarobacter sp.]|nr:FtsX-like permease family protein [Candidatus Elarobacter sp.]
MTLIDVALAFCPAEFRGEYRDQIRAGTHAGGGTNGATFLDVVWIGLTLHAEAFGRNLKTAVRSIMKSPVSAAVIVGTLAIAMGGNIAVFTAFNAALLQPLPFPDANRLVRITIGDPAKPGATLLLAGMDKAVAANVHSFDAVAAVAEDPGAIIGSDVTYAAHRGIATPNFFSVLGAPPELGRNLSASDVGRASVVISDQLWRSRFGSDPHVLGQRLRFTPSSALQPLDFTIAGVAPPALESIRKGPFHPDFWSITRSSGQSVGDQGSGSPLITDTFGKLRADVTPVAAASDAQRIVKQLFPPGQPVPDAAKSMRALVMPLNSDALDEARYLWTLFAAVIAVLLVACLNVGNLLLTRAASRTQEFVLRSALGASSGQIASLLIYESTLFAVLGVVFGAWLGITVFSTALSLSPAIAKLPNVRPDGHVLAFIVVLMAFVALFAGVLPTMIRQRRRGDDGAGIRAGTRTGAFAAPRLRFALGVAEIGFAFPLLVAAGLLLHSFLLASNVGHGFPADNLYEADYNLPAAKYSAAGNYGNAVDQLTQRIRAIPGVTSVGYADHSLVSTFFGDQYTLKPGGTPIGSVNAMSVTPQFFQTLGLPIAFGRNFNDGVSSAASNEVIVDQRLAKLFDAGDPRAKHVYAQGFGGSKVLSVAGVASSITNTAASDQPTLYTRAFATPVDGRHQFSLFVRTNGNVPSLSTQIASITTHFDTLVAAPAIRPVADILAVKDASWRAGMILLSCLAAAALLLALVGIYGVTSHAVEARTSELGIRLAVGAPPRAILGLVLRSQLTQSAIGLLIGLTLSVFVTQALSSQLYEITPLDPLTYVLVALTLLATGLLAALLPGIRAMRVDPAVALRHE